MIQLIFAYCPTKTVDNKNEFAFGLNTGLPWGHIKQDMQNFASRTKDTVLIMGAKTFMSLRGKLHGRSHIVVQDFSRPYAKTKSGQTAELYINETQFQQFLEGNKVQVSGHDFGYNCFIQRDDANYSVIGGAHIIEHSRIYADKIICTTIRKKHRVNSDIKLSADFIWNISEDMELVETHWYNIDELTNISEDVYERA
ncbi:dihydrofolate reductase [Salmonella phage vB_SenM-AKM_NP4]|uniref:dihydrofolate reductase n=1 Tax=Salmonella phage S16 TaxID=1087482 RepID=M1EAR0_BPS16|nr:dihydrofolate reductase [Salmonella phage vB_SenM-S16]AEO97159.1 dihydrofolate reductase [Salmonella phage vB_SenM-S16]UPW42343.1 dihydrofolate reductase [Salmonella phage CF-SP2]WDR21892.1 dihydrofolate reductase [Salmonella phage vB_SenM_UTK0003]WLI71853.1 dihydrofolate reductase [Salmonella phage vB_SenM-AKM_NP4]